MRCVRAGGLGVAALAWSGVIHRFATVTSTMDEACRLAEAGAPHGTAVMAAVQTAGRGRQGRNWVSQPGNLLATIVLRPGGKASEAPQLSFVVALAVAEAVDALAGPGTRLKWPNDVMRSGAKLAGVLLERLEDGAVLAGVGVNLSHAPDGMDYPVTNLAQLGCDAGPEDVLAVLLELLQAEWAHWQADGFAAVLRRWRARGPELDAQLRVRLDSGVTSGIFAGLGPDGSLRLRVNGVVRVLVAGDVLG